MMVLIARRALLYGAALCANVAEVYDAAAPTYDANYADSITARTLNFEGLRRQTLELAQGSVLEIGVGTGLNLPLYRSGSISSLDAVDISDGMLEIAAPRAKQAMTSLSTNVRLRRADASALPFADRTFDSVVDTFSLCVFDRPAAVLSEARRTLRPGGRLLLLESDASALSGALSFTRRTTETATSCSYDQDVLALVRSAGFAVQATESRAGGLFRSVVAVKPTD